MRDNLYWLPKVMNFAASLKAIKQKKFDSPAVALDDLRALARHDLDFTEIAAVDRVLLEWMTAEKNLERFPRIRLAILGSSTLDQVLPSIRVAGLRRGVIIDCYLGAYNQYRQEILDDSSPLYNYKPDVVLLALDFEEALVHPPLETSLADIKRLVEERLNDWSLLWKKISQSSGAVVIQQTLVIPFRQWFGQLDAQIPAIPTTVARRMNAELCEKAKAQGILILDVDALASSIGKQTWQDLPLWFNAKQAVSPLHAPLYGDIIARMLGAIRGLSKKCLVLDLDNTLWGGVIGDDGLEGIELGQGSGVGEAFLAFQTYAKQLKERGIILAVCSKNDEKIARLAFEKHPEMALKLDDIAMFVATWDDKASNLKRIAEALNIGLDSLVFFDDNPAERGLIRQVLPQVEVPEVPEDPAGFVSCMSDAGYFEAISFTADDLKRGAHYQANAQRQASQGQSGTLDEFLKSLAMTMALSPFDEVGLSRITQLINKSNQFNLTTRRYTETQVKQLISDPNALTFQVRLKDAYGDNGMISVVIAKPEAGAKKVWLIDTWLMSCRVLGRQVEQEILNQLVEEVRRRGGSVLRGEYIPTAKNELVSKHYPKLGFKPLETAADPVHPGRTLWELAIEDFKKIPTWIACTFEQGVAS